MATNYHDLLRMLAPLDLADDIRGINRAGGDDVLDVHFEANRLALIEKASQLFGIFRRHADDGNVVDRIEAKRAGVRQIHAPCFRAALSSNHGGSMGSVCRLEERAILHVHLHALFARKISFGAHQQDLACPIAGVLLGFAIQLRQVDGNHVRLDAALGS